MYSNTSPEARFDCSSMLRTLQERMNGISTQISSVKSFSQRRDLNRMVAGIMGEVRELSKLDVDLRRTQHLTMQIRCKELYVKINEDLDHLEQWIIIAILS